MGLRDLFRRKRVQAESERPTQVNSRPIGVKTVGDYLHYVGNVLDVNLKDATNYRGRLVDLSADCSKLILRDVTEYDISSTHREVTLAKHDRVLIPVADVNLVEVKDRGIQTE